MEFEWTLTGNSKERELMKSKNLGGKGSGEVKSHPSTLGCFGSDESDHQEQTFALKPSPDQLNHLGVSGHLGRNIYQGLNLNQDADFASAKYSRPKSNDHGAGSSESPCHSSYSSHSSSCSASSRPSLSSPVLAKMAHGDNSNYVDRPKYGACLKSDPEEYDNDGENLNEPEYEEEDYDEGQNGDHRINNTTASTINPNDLSDSDDECEDADHSHLHHHGDEEPSVDKQENEQDAFFTNSNQPDQDSNS